jgi:hypothetical protein
MNLKLHNPARRLNQETIPPLVVVLSPTETLRTFEPLRIVLEYVDHSSYLLAG